MTPDQIIDAVVEVTGVERKWITGEGLNRTPDGKRPDGWRTVQHVDARRLATVSIFKTMNTTLCQAGRACGMVDHTTVIHHLHKHRDLMRTDFDYTEKYNRVQTALALTDEDKENAILLHFMEQYEAAKTIAGRRQVASSFFRAAREMETA